MLCKHESGMALQYVFRYYKNNEIFKVYTTRSLSDVIEVYSTIEKRIENGEYHFVILTVYNPDGIVMTRQYMAKNFDYISEFNKLK